MAGLSRSQVAQLNTIAARNRAKPRQPIRSGGSSSLLQNAGLMKLANAVANGSYAYNSDPLAGSQKKLTDSIQAIMQSNAPGGLKNVAAGYSTDKTIKKDQSAFDQIKSGLGTGVAGLAQVLSLPETLVSQPIRRLIDPKRNLLKDIKSGEITSSALAGADWFKGLPTPAKIVIGISADIATDPLTYVLGAGIISKLGQAPGIIQKIDKAFQILKTAGRLEDAERLITFGGNLARKGKGGIGGIKNNDLAWIGRTLEETGVADLGGKTLKGGLYFQPPGTGRIASYGAKKLTGVGIDSAKYQIYLGRGPAVEAASRFAANRFTGAKTSKLMKTLGDKYGGGEGELKRAILNAESPQEALNLRRTLDSNRIKQGTRAVVIKMSARKDARVLKLVEETGVDQKVIVGALDGTKADIETLNAAFPGGSDLVRALDDQLITETTEQITRVVKQFGGDVNDVAPLVERAKDHLHGVLTDEARAGMKASKKLKYRDDGVMGFMLPSKFVPGADHIGTPIADVSDTLTRSFIYGEDGRKYILLGEDNKPAVAMAAEHGTGATAEQAVLAKVGETLDNNAKAAAALGVDGPVTQIRYIDKDGKIIPGWVSTSDIRYDELAPNGLGPKTQVNAINREHYGHDLFSTDYRQIRAKQINDFAEAAGNEVQGLYLKSHGLAVMKGEEKTVAASIAAERGIEVSADAATDPAFQTAVIANIDDPAKIQVAAIAANGAADARMALPAEPADFSLLSLAPDEAQVHIDGVLDDVQVQADVLASSSAKANPERVGDIQTSIGRTEARIDIANDHISSLDRLIADAEQMNAGMPKQVAVESSPPSRPTLDAPEKSLSEMTAEELAMNEKSLDSQLGNVDQVKPGLQAELDNAQRYEDLVASTRVSRQDLNDLRGEVKTEAGQVASQMRAQVDSVGGRLESPWNSPGGEWDWWKQLSRSQQRALRPYMGGGEPVRNGANLFGGAAVGRVSDGMGVDVFAEQWRQIRNLSPDANISEIMDDWANHILQMKDAEKVASSAAGYTSLVQDWMAPGVFGDSARRLTTELLFPSEKLGDTAIAENLSQHLAREFSDVGTPTPSVTPDTPTVELPPLSTNPTRIGDMSRFGGKVYREVDAKNALEIIPQGGIFGDNTLYRTGIFASNDPAYALGQAENAGIKLEFDTKGLTGKVSSDKPGWQANYENGYAEFKLVNNDISQLSDSLTSVRVPANFKAGLQQNKLTAALGRLEAQGWLKQEFPDDSVVYTRNGSVSSASKQMDAGISSVPTRSVAEIKAELDRLATSSDDLVNRYQGAMSEYGRREALIAAGQPVVPQKLIGNPDLLEVSELKSLRESIIVTMQGDVDSLRLLTERGIDEAAYKAWTNSAKGQQGLANAVLEGWVGISRHTQVPEQIHEAMAMLTKVTGPDALPGLFRYFDKATNLFKSWAIASPGFVMRNGIGGMFNNYLIGVDAGRYWEFLKADRAYTSALKRTGDVEQALAAVPARLNKQYRLLHASGVLAETDRASDAVFGLTRSLGQGDQTRDAFGWLGNNVATRGVYAANSRMERVLRGAAGMDAAAKTGSLEGIYESVFKAHFDYADLNMFEVNWMKRISPFYTWTRKNLPLQMEMLFRNPKAYNRYNIFKKNIESVTPEEDLVPTWMKDRLNIRLPFTNKDGQMYIMPDLPFTSLNIFTNADELAGQINPVIKTPVEMMMNRKMYFGKSAPFKEGYVQMPDILTKTGIAQVMGVVGLAEQDKQGNYMTRDKTLYAAEQFLPFFGRMRRLLPSEKKYDERAATTWLNFLFGTGLRTNTMTDRSSELYFRQRSVDQIAKDLNSLGYGGYTYWNKRVETSRKPKDTDKRPYLTLNQPKGGLGAGSAYTNVRSSSKLSPEAFQAAMTQLTRMRNTK